ncbi:gluconate:H+ symporter [Nocardioides sp.]|uniref:GntP family permease n=1 Tax=Nocardioides sp. TaxID=35761 RepID=UPI001A2F71F0|nr:gluconate:H+ symporter [Nocardioides sp.]MBJ7359036.1 gluconate transporter [Nocardioides sp.]
MHPQLVLAAEDLVEPVAPGWQLMTAALVAIALIVVLITVAKLSPFLALILGGLTVGIIAGENILVVLDSFSAGFGSTAAGVGVLIALGAMFAKLLADSGGADQIVDTIVGRSSTRMLPWAMALVGAIIGLPMFFEIGLVLLMPVIYLVSRRAQVSLITVGIPALAGLSAMHGFVPPHPGPVTAVDLLGADLGMTLALGLVVAVPTIVVAGPMFGALAGRWVVVEAPQVYDTSHETADTGVQVKRRPTFAVTLGTVLLPVVLMLSKSLSNIVIEDEEDLTRQVFDVIGAPFVALLIAVLVAMFTFGTGVGMTRKDVGDTVTASLGPIAAILLIVAAGGGFKQVLVDTGIGTLLADWARDADVSVLLLAWVLAVLIRLATGSATVATITASSLLIDLVSDMSTTETSLVVLAVGAGSVFFSHVNDAGFWLVKEYFGMSVGQTVKTWSLMETVLSVTGLIVVLLLGLVL